MNKNNEVSGLPKLAKSIIWMINFGFLGVQIAFTLQGSQMSRIFQTIGANPNNLGWFFLLPPLAGLIVQPIIGYYSCLLYTSPSPRDPKTSRMPSSA